MDFRRFRHYTTTFNPLAGDFSVALKPLRLIPMTLACAAVLSVSTPVLAQQASVSDEERAKIETVIQEYLMSNPGIIINALEKHQNNRQAEQDKQFQSVFKTNKDALYASNAPSFGPKDADVTIVEFYDYNCGYCKKAFADVAKLREEDKNVRFIFMEMPILSENSYEVAKWSLAADKQGKFFEFHTALMQFTGMKDKAFLEKTAKEVGLDTAKMATDAEAKEVHEHIEANLKMARELGISGTPGFIINDKLVPGYMGYDSMKGTIADIRAGKDAGKN